MRRGPIILLLLALLLAAGYGARRLEGRSWDSLLQYTPPYAQAAAAATGTAPTAPLAPRLVLIMVDGLSATDAQRLPTVAYLRDQGAMRRMAALPTPWPAASWATLLTGAPPDLHGVVMSGQADRPLGADNLLSAARRSGKSVAAAADPALGTLLKPWLDRGFYSIPADATAASAGLIDWLRTQTRAGGPDLVLVHLPFPHAAAHRTGAQKPPPHDTLAALDATIAQFLDQVDLHQTAIAVVGSLPTDAGGRHTGSAAAVDLPFVVAGPGVQPGFGPDCQLVDVAPTLAEILGTSLPAWSVGQPQWSMLQLTPDSLTARLQALVAQQRTFFAAYAGVYGYEIDLPAPAAEPAAVHGYLQALQAWAAQARQEAVRRGILHRLPWVAGAWLLILFYLLVISRQPYSLSLTLGALAYSVLYYAVFFLRGGRFSPDMPGLESMGKGVLQQQLWVAGAVMAVAALYLGWHLGRRGFRRGAYVCLIALHTCLVILGLVAAQALIPVLVDGLHFTWFLPGVGGALYYFYGLQQIAVVGFGAPLWMLLALVTARLTAAGARTGAEAAPDPKVIPLPERRRAMRQGRGRSS